MNAYLRNFRLPMAVSGIGLAAGLCIGYVYSHTLQGALTALFLTFVLAILEISLSLDNAVVNASVLKQMTPPWRRRFLNWGIWIAVFGVRVVLPLAIVSLVAGISPWRALILAATQPRTYAHLILASHMMIAGFGGSFLLMVALRYFFNQNKSVHWLEIVERPLALMGKIEAIEMAVCLVLFLGLSRFLPDPNQRLTLIAAGILGMVTNVFVDGISAFLRTPDGATQAVKANLALFVYLEVLDASFSFDGVVGAFALSQNLFIIAVGLGIGAVFVRSLTLMIVDSGRLERFVYLEHGAFYAIAALAIIMLLDIFFQVPEIVTGLVGAAIIGLSLISSIRRSRYD